MKHKILIVGLAVVATLISSRNAEAQSKTLMTLRQCIEAGIANNFNVKQAELQAQTDKSNWTYARLSLLPNLNGSAGLSFNQGRSIDPFTNQPVTQSFNSSNYGITSNVILFSGLALQNAIKQTSLTYQASQADWQQQKDNVTINIILTYLQVLTYEDQLTQLGYQASSSKQQVDRLQNMFNQGALSKPSDLSDLQGQYSGDQLSIINTQNALETAKISLCNWMNIPYNKDIELERIDVNTIAAKYEDTPDKIYQTALQNFAQIKAVDLRVKSAAKAVQVQRGYLWPQLSFGANVTTNYSSVARQSQYINTTTVTSDSYVDVGGTQYPLQVKQDNFSSNKISYNDQLNNNLYTSYGFNLSIPIFNNWRQRTYLKQAKINYQLRDFTAKYTKTQLNQSINQAYANMISASGRLTTLTDQTAAYSESFRQSEIRFTEGVTNSIVEYLLSKSRIDGANIGLINAKYDYILRMKILDYYEGKPLW
ncbi:MAG: TolC family protein [Chitinophagaceae bacterium]